jgi:hypothetical protein
MLAERESWQQDIASSHFQRRAVGWQLHGPVGRSAHAVCALEYPQVVLESFPEFFRSL